MFVCCECCVLSGRGLCDGLITRRGESYRLWRVVVCDQVTSYARRLSPIEGCKIHTHYGLFSGRGNMCIYIYIYITKHRLEQGALFLQSSNEGNRGTYYYKMDAHIQKSAMQKKRQRHKFYIFISFPVTINVTKNHNR
jgi:hypothetical protein